MATVDDLARKHGVSAEAVRVLQDAIKRGSGRQAQFSHPDLGGMGQWSAGGMTQIGDMFNADLKAKVNALCADLAKEPADHDGSDATPQTQSHQAGNWWPDGLGQPSSSGAQNGMRYACFPDSHRVAIEQAGVVTLYDSGRHEITGVSQQQSSTQELTFSSRDGTIRAADLPVAE